MGNQLVEKLQEQEGVTNRGEYFVASRNKEGYHSMLNNPGEYSAASYIFQRHSGYITIPTSGNDDNN